MNVCQESLEAKETSKEFFLIACSTKRRFNREFPLLVLIKKLFTIRAFIAQLSEAVDVIWTLKKTHIHNQHLFAFGIKKEVFKENIFSMFFLLPQYFWNVWKIGSSRLGMTSHACSNHLFFTEKRDTHS